MKRERKHSIPAAKDPFFENLSEMALSKLSTYELDQCIQLMKEAGDLGVDNAKSDGLPELIHPGRPRFWFS